MPLTVFIFAEPRDWYETMSSSLSVVSCAVDGEVGGSVLYVIVTLRFDFHIGSVEWVTCHVPESQAGVGGMKSEAWGRSVVVGARMSIWEAMDGGCLRQRRSDTEAKASSQRSRDLGAGR